MATLPTPPTHPAPPTPAAPALLPVAPTERLTSVDTLRGFALLGILAMNITSFALPPASYLNPMGDGLAPYQGDFTGVNKLAWWVQYLVFDMKMMTIFSMLFGAGLVLMDSRAAPPTAPLTVTPTPTAPAGFAAIYYRRLLVLGVIGLLHAYLVWFGDILFVYALCGLVLYPLRRARPGALLATGVGLVLFGCAIWTLFGGLLALAQSEAAAAQAIADTGTALSTDQQSALDHWHAARESFDPTMEQAAAQVEAMRGTYAQIFKANSEEAMQMHAFVVPVFFVWRTVGVMLIGMAFMKLGVFGARRSARFYTGLALAGYGLGVPLLLVGGKLLIDTRFDAAASYLYTGQFNAIGSLFAALGHIGVVMLICRAGVLAGTVRRLGAVGRMAFTNYLAQSLICTATFFGWGLGYFGSFERGQLMLFVVGVWGVQLLWSPWWLARFRFGPAEWVWRSLTYMKMQPMRPAK